jgi:hypothetical protein
VLKDRFQKYTSVGYEHFFAVTKKYCLFEANIQSFLNQKTILLAKESLFSVQSCALTKAGDYLYPIPSA